MSATKISEKKTMTIPMEKVEEILEILKTVGLKLCVVGSCCRDIESVEADGIEIIAREIGYALGEAKDILEDGREQEVSA